MSQIPRQGHESVQHAEGIVLQSTLCVGCCFLYSCVGAVQICICSRQSGWGGRGVGWGSWEGAARRGGVGWVLDGCVEWELDCIIDMQGGEWFFVFFQCSFVCVCIPFFFSPPFKNKG